MSYERRIYQHIIPALGRIPLDKLTARDIQQFYTNLKKSGRLIRTELYGAGLSDQTVRGIHTTLRAALDKAVEEKLIFRNPADSCKPPSARPREMQVLTPEEIQRLLIQAKEDGCYELLLLELATGLRRGEILALRWSDPEFPDRRPAGGAAGPPGEGRTGGVPAQDQGRQSDRAPPRPGPERAQDL